MKYALLFFETAEEMDKRSSPTDAEAYWAAWTAYSQAANEAGIMPSGAALEPPSQATTLRLKDSARNVQDGPIADSKERFGGFFILDVPDLDTALAWAAKAPCAGAGGVEVRPLMQQGDG
ncbi:MAG: YciI family protein, partial [Pseudomonadota bacterium]